MHSEHMTLGLLERPTAKLRQADRSIELQLYPMR